MFVWIPLLLAIAFGIAVSAYYYNVIFAKIEGDSLTLDGQPWRVFQKIYRSKDQSYLACRFAFAADMPSRLPPFELSQETGLSEMLKQFRFIREFQTGDQKFDETIFITTDDSQIHRLLREDGHLRSIILEIFSDPEVQRIRFQPGQLSAWLHTTEAHGEFIEQLASTEKSKKLRQNLSTIKNILQNSIAQMQFKALGSGVVRGYTLTLFAVALAVATLYLSVNSIFHYGTIATTDRFVFYTILAIPGFFLLATFASFFWMLRTAWAPYFLAPLFILFAPTTAFLVPAGIRYINYDPSIVPIVTKRKIESWKLGTSGGRHPRTVCHVRSLDPDKGTRTVVDMFEIPYCSDLTSLSKSGKDLYFEYDLHKGRLGLTWYSRQTPISE